MNRLYLGDEMTPKERMKAFAEGRPIDRIPAVPMVGVTLAPSFGINTYDYYNSSELMVDLEIQLYKEFGHDGVGVGLGLHGIAEAMGTILEYPKNSVCYVKEPVLKSLKEVDRLLPANPYKDGRIPLRLEALKVLKAKVGGEVDVGGDMPAPFSAAASVVGVSNLMKALIKSPKEVHKLLRVVTETSLRVIDAFCEIGVDLSLCDPVASSSMISHKKYEEFAMPYTKMCIDRMREKSGKGTTLHICGKSKEIWEYMLKTGMTTLSLDNVEDIEEAKNSVGSRVCIAGNVNPVDTIRNGTVEEVIKETKKCIDKAKDSPKGFILSTGCQIPIGSPLENIHAFMKVARDYVISNKV